jgi:hypothetical protein
MADKPYPTIYLYQKILKKSDKFFAFLLLLIREAELLKKNVFHSKNCRECLISEPLGVTFRCKFYGRAYMSAREEKPPYCRVTSIIVTEARERPESAAIQNNGNKNFPSS